MKINKKLLPIKAHWFFFMAAMGPILPQLSVLGKEIGISPQVMGRITGVLPITFLLAKPAFGLLVDVQRKYRKTIFMLLIVIMTLSYAVLNFIPVPSRLKFQSFTQTSVDTCNGLEKEAKCDNKTVRVTCTSKCWMNSEQLIAKIENSSQTEYKTCTLGNVTLNSTCGFTCNEDLDTDESCLYSSLTFWGFVLLMSLGTIGFNVTNSTSDAICFDVIGEEYDYGKQRVWGTIGFGITALISGYVIDMVSGSSISYAPAFMIMLICSVADLFSCVKLKLPIIEAPKNIWQDLRKLFSNRRVVVFIIFAICVGVLDGFIVYFLFWFLEDLAKTTNTNNVKLIEGLIVAAETLGGEVIFFSIAGKILERIGHIHCFSMCFVNYALRLGLISLVPSPWWIIPIEFVLQGPTYALTYTTIVAYANELAPPGASATMQGIAAGMDDGIGYAIGSVIGGLLYSYVGGMHTLQILSAFGLACSVAHLVIHRTVLHDKDLFDNKSNGQVEYKGPEEAYNATVAE